MHRLRAVLAGCLLTALGCAAGTPAAHAVEPIRPYGGVQVAAADSGETAVLWRTATGAIQAAIGAPGAAFSAPVTIAPDRPTPFTPIVRMDAAGDVVVVWEAIVSHDCDSKANCITDSLGVFAAIRPAGGSFGAPVRLLAPQPASLANPALAMNRAGDWIVAVNVGSARVVGAGKRATPPAAFAPLPLPGTQEGTFALDEAGTTTFAGTDAANHPATIVRAADGTFGAPAVLDDASILGHGMALGVGPQGHAVAIWPGGGVLRWATREPGGNFGAPTSSAITANFAPEWIGVDAQGRTITVRQPAPAFPARFTLEALRGTVSAPFESAATLTAADRDVGGPTRFAMSAGGTAAIGWLETNRFSSPVAQAAVAFDAGPFATLRALTSGVSGAVETPAVAADGAGRAVLAWSELAGNAQRILVANVTPTAIAGPTVVVQSPLVNPPVPQGFALANTSQVLRIRADNTIRPVLRCVSTTTCSGTLRIDVRPAPGRKRVRLGSHRFVFKAGRVQRVIVRATKAARRAAAHRSLRGTITVTSTVTGGGAARTMKSSLIVRRRSS